MYLRLCSGLKPACRRNEAQLVVNKEHLGAGSKLRQIEAEGGVDHDITTLGRFTYATP